MEDLLRYFTYKGIARKVNDDEITLKDVSLNNVVFEFIHCIENDHFLDKFHDITFESIKITENIIELHLDDKLVKELTDWYCPTGNVYPFVYKIEDGDLILTKVIYTPETHLFNSLLKFPYYTVQEIDFDECFCFQNNFCTKEYHGENMRSTHGYEFYHCTQFVLYNCKFFDRLYDKIYICSECSLLKVQNRIYSLYVDGNQQDIQLPPKYKPKTLYQHVFDGDEPGYYSGGGGTCYQLELVGYKMGVKIMCDLLPHYKKGETIRFYLFDYKTSIALITEGAKTESKLYLHLGNLELDNVKENMSRKEFDEGKEKMSQKELDRFTEITNRQNILQLLEKESVVESVTPEEETLVSQLLDDRLKNIEDRLTRMEKTFSTLFEVPSDCIQKSFANSYLQAEANIQTNSNRYTFPLINDYVSSDDEMDDDMVQSTKEFLVREGITNPRTFSFFGAD